MQLKRPFTGVIAAPLLPMTEDQAVDWKTLDRYMDWIAGQKPAAIAMNMDASEVISLTEEEQFEVVAVCRKAIGGRVPLLSGVVAGSTKAAAAKAARLRDAGVDGFAIFPPFPTFSGAPVPEEMIVRYHRAIADASGLPIICFQFPKGWGPDYTPAILKAIAEIPQLVAIKESSFDVAQTQSTIEHAAKLKQPIGVLTGSDTFIFEAMVMGCTGALIGFGGTATAELVAMYAAVERGDISAGKAIWDRLGPLARYCWKPPIRDFRPRMKEALKLQGIFPHATCREPQLGVGEDERKAIEAILRTAGMLGTGMIRKVG
ncbi:MAG: dihydrodipicolinate synthase family protein [Rhodospirillales bacterium]|nr:dihydrodipicolinate synthase family protein [Rhodospirillales bacterium]